MTTEIERIACFVDGFNLYHAVHDLGDPPLKWLDIRALCGRYAAQEHQHIVAVHYFSAYATWLPDAYRRHRAFVRALVETGVKPVMGVFKDKTRTCRKCRCSFPVHEEKQTDVNIEAFTCSRGPLPTSTTTLSYYPTTRISRPWSTW